MSEHIVSRYDEELNDVARRIAEMGGMAERLVDVAVGALIRVDTATAKTVIADDKKLDTLQRECEERAIMIIARRQPMAMDLREVIAAQRIASDLERIGYLAKNIAKRVPMIHAEGEERIEAISILPSVAQIASDMVHDVLDAFSARDAAMAEQVCARDTALDDFYDSIFRTLVTFMVENPRTISQVAHLLFVAKNIERIGDHATNVAEMVYFAATGSYLADREAGEPGAN